jgi:hypothetical protein
MIRSVRGLRGAAIVTKDGALGSVEQVFFDDERWAVRYLVARLGRGFAARRVLVSPRAITGVDLSRKAVTPTSTRNDPSPGRRSWSIISISTILSTGAELSSGERRPFP